jgi:1-acyl-sn-glycerol-3-phosphate acyltransferase
MSGSRLLGLTRTIPYLLFTLAMMPVQALLLALHLPARRRFPLFYHRWATRILGLDIVVRGTPSAEHPTLFVSNHSSYFDITVLASLVEVSFIAKSDMINWPFFGRLAKMQRSVFVDRKPSNVTDHANDVASRLADGDSLVLFAEGTTSDGNRLLPFKSALFSVAEQASPEKPLTIQPVSVVATHLDGIPLGRSLRPIYSWFGDMPLLSHAWEAVCTGRLTVVVEFHPAFAANGIRRKALAERCHRAVLGGFTRAICGRYPEIEAENREEKAEEGEEIEAAA